MGLFDLFKRADINEGYRQYKQTENALLLDVRTREEYAQGHIQGSVNIPLQALSSIADTVEDPQTPLFVHCLSGARSAQAVSALKSMGYQAVNIGGISSWKGELIK